MKRFAAVLAVLMLMLSCALAETAPKEILWSNSEAVAAKYEGTLAPLSDIGIQMYVPNTVVDQKLTQEQSDKNYFLFMSTEGNAFTVVGQILPMSLELFKTGLDNSGVKAEATLLNGISCYTFEITTELGKAIGVAFSANGGEKTVTIQMSPVTEETSEMVNMMLASIQEVK